MGGGGRRKGRGQKKWAGACGEEQRAAELGGGGRRKGRGHKRWAGACKGAGTDSSWKKGQQVSRGRG